MRDVVRVCLVVAAVIAAAASASPPKPHTFEKTMRTGSPVDQTWQAVISVFAKQNWIIQSMDKESGLITADWINIGGGKTYADCGSASSTVPIQMRFNIFVRPDSPGAGSSVTVNAEFRVLVERQYYNCYSTGATERSIHELVVHELASQPPPPPPPPKVLEAPPPADGTEGGKCYGNQTCNSGLICDPAGVCQPEPAPTP